jgi:hypothetical protein
MKAGFPIGSPNQRARMRICERPGDDFLRMSTGRSGFEQKDEYSVFNHLRGSLSGVPGYHAPVAAIGRVASIALRHEQETYCSRVD